MPKLDSSQTRGRIGGCGGYARREHVVGGVLLERAGGGLEKVDDVLVLLVVRTIASDVEGRRASSVLGELIGPERLVGLALADPVLVHCEAR